MRSRANAYFAVVATLLSLYTASARAEGDVGGKAQDQATNAFIDRFLKFTLNKDVMGRAKKPDGSVVAKGPKSRFNGDDGGLFQSDLTYHDNSYNDVEEEKGQKGPDGKQDTKESVLFAFVSPHGKFSGAGGSSLLERTAYQLHKQFTKQEEDPKNNKDDDKQGIKFRSLFKIETQEVFNDDKKGGAAGAGAGGAAAGGGAAAANGKNDKKGEADKVERFTVREEARPQIDEVGVKSFEEVQKAARDQGFEEDNKTMANMTFLREAAGRAAVSMWNSSLANLAQRRFFKGIQVGALGETPKISEGNPTIEGWAQAVQGSIAKAAKGDEQLQKALGEDLQRMRKQGGQMAGVGWDKIDPRFEIDQKGQIGKNGEVPETLQFLGPQKEDPFQRDLRVQLGVLDKAGKKAGAIQSNWKYDAKDEQTQLLEYDESGAETGKRTVTVDQQINSYNRQLQDAAKGMEEIKARFPDYKGDPAATLGYQIAPNSRSVMDINRPTESMMEELGSGQGPAANMPKNYNELLKTGGDPQ